MSTPSFSAISRDRSLFWRKKPGFFYEYQQLSLRCFQRNPVSGWLRSDRLSGRLASGDET
ncbi:hypothetical protein [Planktothricoides sp. SR001]|uniref:hypothetical protein n=1 Tax=Planktothricoides sp. SR001 TaxID=1705388 RepID=UPI0012E1A278|nr:hypothetical protein [Planktothricoides sp. SR001]